uniref:Uncharacterized protein n=1 Tax=Rhizophora mucronata TaxID=61149 RepID=A0A2P2PC17_RHIMU
MAFYVLDICLSRSTNFMNNWTRSGVS